MKIVKNPNANKAPAALRSLIRVSSLKHEDAEDGCLTCAVHEVVDNHGSITVSAVMRHFRGTRPAYVISAIKRLQAEGAIA